MRRVELISPEDIELRLADSLRQRRMPDPFLYVGSGARNWLDLDSSQDFPVASRLEDLLSQSIPDLVRLLPDHLDLVSLGVGAGRKERLLLTALKEREHTRYLAVDISAPLVDTAMEAVADLGVPTTGIVAFAEDLPLIRGYWSPPAMVCLLGNNFSNYDPAMLLPLVRQQLGPKDLFLFDCHLLPPGGTEEVALIYGSSQNARFNTAPLVDRGMDCRHCSFHLEVITCDTSAGPAIRTRKWLHLHDDGEVRCGPADVLLEAGDEIELGFTFKWTQPQVSVLLERGGFRSVWHRLSEDSANLLVLASVQES